MSWGVDQTLRERLGRGTDMRDKTETEGISDNRKELLDDLLDIILKHKKEIRKVPQASHITTATEYAKKRGLSATQVDLDNDGTPETVVWDRSGRFPYIVNGYKLAPSDYHVRNAYWGTHPNSEDRVEEPMDDWIDNKVYKTTGRKDNRWITDRIEVLEQGRKLQDWSGYSMPTKPKRVMSPYSVFSKLIAPMVKGVWREKAFYDAFGIELSKEGVSYTDQIFRKIISPIAIYRALYLRMIEQKFYFVKCDANGGQPINYASFKKYLKEERGKKEFYNWFFTNCLQGADKSEFNPKYVNMDLVVETLVPKLEGDKIRQIDVLFHLLGEANWNNPNPFVIDSGTQYTLQDVLKNDNVAKIVFAILQDKDHPYFRAVKKNLEIARKTSQMSTDAYIGKSNVANIIVDNEAYTKYKDSIRKTGSPNHVLPQSPPRGGFAQHVMEQARPAEEPPAQPAEEVLPGQKRLDDFFQ